MKKKFHIALTAFTLFSMCVAAYAVEIDPNVRPKQTKEITFRDGKTKTIPFLETLYVDDQGVISIIPGETLHIQFTYDKKSKLLTKPRLCLDKKRYKKCVVFHFIYKDGIPILSVKNPYDKELSYSCGAISDEGNGISGRNNFPVQAKLITFESYSGKELILLFKDFKLNASDAP